MPKRLLLPPETQARNAFFESLHRRAWALVAFMVEHEEVEVGPGGVKQERCRDRLGRRVFRGGELNKHLLPVRAGFGGYAHPAAAGISRTDVVRAMAREAEREGWITRDRDRCGGVPNYAVTEEGRSTYQNIIEPQRDAFVKDYLKARNAPSGKAAPRPAIVRVKRAAGEIRVAREERIAALRTKYERGESAGDCCRPVDGGLNRSVNRGRLRAEPTSRPSMGPRAKLVSRRAAGSRSETPNPPCSER